MRRREEEEPQELPQRQQGLTQKQKDEIVEVLTKRGAKLPCPRCGNKTFALVDGYFNQVIQAEFQSIVLAGRTVPTIAVACDRCGYLSHHALGILGLLPKEGSKTTEGGEK